MLKNDHSMMVRSDAKAIGMVTAIRSGFTVHKPRTATIALSDTLCTRADGTQYIIPANSRSRRKPSYKRTGVMNTQAPVNRDLALMAQMGTIHTEV